MKTYEVNVRALRHLTATFEIQAAAAGAAGEAALRLARGNGFEWADSEPEDVRIETITEVDGPIVQPVVTREEQDFLINGGASLPETVLPMPIWMENGPEEDRTAMLKAFLVVGGARLRMEAIAVRLVSDTWSDELCDFPTIPWGSEATGAALMVYDKGVDRMEDLGALWTAHGMQGHAETVEINGRRYVVFASPFCD
jgi:hypothetical protein